MLSPTASTIRLLLHVLGATVWVGGQVVLGGLVPVLRREAPEATKAVARAFARMAWPAFALLVVSGVENLAEIDVAETSTSYQATVFVKVALSTVQALCAAILVWTRRTRSASERRAPVSIAARKPSSPSAVRN